jgi:hypothetical protein
VVLPETFTMSKCKCIYNYKYLDSVMDCVACVPNRTFMMLMFVAMFSVVVHCGLDGRYHR